MSKLHDKDILRPTEIVDFVNEDIPIFFGSSTKKEYVFAILNFWLAHIVALAVKMRKNGFELTQR